MNWNAVLWAYGALGLLFILAVDWRRVLGTLASIFHIVTWPISFVIEFANWYASSASRYLGRARGARRG